MGVDPKHCLFKLLWSVECLLRCHCIHELCVEDLFPFLANCEHVCIVTFTVRTWFHNINESAVELKIHRNVITNYTQLFSVSIIWNTYQSSDTLPPGSVKTNVHNVYFSSPGKCPKKTGSHFSHLILHINQHCEIVIFQPNFVNILNHISSSI